MRGMRWIVAAAAIVAAFTQARAMAQEAATKPASMTPLEVLADAFEALEAGKIERYVDHLTAHEQRMQAGYILYLVVALTVSNEHDAANPEMILLAQVMRDVAIRHLVVRVEPRDRRPGDPQPTDETPEMVVRNLLTPIFVQPVYEGHEFEQRCLKASQLLMNPRGLLIDALNELATTTEVSGAAPDRPAELFDLALHARMYQEVKWTLYTRGDRALAVPQVAKAENPPTADNKAAEPAKSSPPAPAPSGDDSETFHIVFRKIDGQWKIDRLLPIAKMGGGIRIDPKTTQSMPAYPAN